MSTVVQTVREVAQFVEREPRSRWIIAPMREVADISERVSLFPYSRLTEVAEISDFVQSLSYAKLTDTAELSDAVYTSASYFRDVRETARLDDRPVLRTRVVVQVTDVAELSDATTYEIPTVLREVATLNDAISASAVFRVTVRDTAQLSDRAVTPVTNVVRDVIEISDSTTQRLIVRETPRELARLDDAASPSIRHRADIREVAEFTDRLVTQLDSSADLRDVAYVYGTAVPPSYGRAYTCSIMTWGMSTFSNFHFRTMAGGFAAGANLWKLGAPNDFGKPISSHITTGVVDFGADRMKRLSAVYFAGTAEQPITVTVTGDVDGVKQSYDYDLELRDQTDYRNNRALVGKGFRSRFVQFRIGATDVKYKLLAGAADASVTARRI